MTDPRIGRAFAFMTTPENGERWRLEYEPANGEATQVVEGVVGDAHLTEWTALITDDGAYTVYGTGWGGRETGEVARAQGAEHSARKIGTFLRATRMGVEE